MKYLIYFLYHSAGKVDSYVPHFLSAVRDQYDVIHVVSNGPLREEHKARLHMADKVQERENDEFDVGAYKAAIFSNPDAFYETCDEVTLANFTFFAPIGSMQPYFDWVAREPRDFWGISAHKEMIPNPFTGTGILPYHIQSHWISVGKRILQSGDFIDYWRNLERIDSYQDSVIKHESQFTRHFAEKGYSYGLFFDDAPYDSAYPAFNCVDESIANGLPLLKRRLFYHNPVLYFDNYDVNLRRALDHIGDHGLFDGEMIWESVATDDPGTLFQANDMLRIVPDASFGPGPQDRTALCDVVMALMHQPSPAQITQILGRIHARCRLHVILPEGTEAEAVRLAAARNSQIAELSLVPCAVGDCYTPLLALADRIAAEDNGAVLFALVDPGDLKRFDYGMRHLCGDAAVAAHAQSELLASAHFGLALPPLRTYGAPSEADMLTDAYRNELRLDLSGMSFKAKLQAPFHFSEAGVFWCRASVLAELAQEIVTNALDQLVTFSDVAAASAGTALQGAATLIDSKKVSSLLAVGLPYLATHLGFITLVVTNTREAPRNLVKAEGRLRLVSEQIGTKSPFLLANQIEYLARYINQEDREVLFAQVQQNAYNEGWTKASKVVWQQAFAAGREQAQGRLAEAARKGGEEFQRGFKEGMVAAAKGQPGMTQAESFDQGFQQGWQEAATFGANGAFDAGFKDGWNKARQFGLGGMMSRGRFLAVRIKDKLRTWRR